MNVRVVAVAKCLGSRCLEPHSANNASHDVSDDGIDGDNDNSDNEDDDSDSGNDKLQYCMCAAVVPASCKRRCLRGESTM